MAEKDIVTVLKKKRTQLRTAVTKLIKTIDEEIEKSNVNYELLEDKLHLLSTTDDELIKYFKPEDADIGFNSSENIIETNPFWGVINGRDEISPEDSPSVNSDDPVPVFPLTIPADPAPVFPLTIPDVPNQRRETHSNSSPNNRTLKTKFGWVCKTLQ
ncbi:hypothetical protein TNCV_4228421 [Trichonephila clavipes]|nr:hypothetical protein TNCV_4228421 [Trichonephila clavipes]